MDRAKIVGLVVTPETCLSRTSAARLPLVSRSRRRSSSHTDTPAARSLASESVIGSSEDCYGPRFLASATAGWVWPVRGRTDGRVVAGWCRRGPCRSAGPPRRAGVLVASGHDAAVDVPDRAGDPAGGRGQQEGDGVGQVAGGADPAQRVEAVEAVQGLVEPVLGDGPLVPDRKSV